VQTALTSRRAADARELAKRQAIHIQAVRGDVLTDNFLGRRSMALQSLAIHQQNLTACLRAARGRTLQSLVDYGLDFGKFLIGRSFSVRGKDFALLPWPLGPEALSSVCMSSNVLA